MDQQQPILDLLDHQNKQQEGDHSLGLRREVDSIDDFEHLGHDDGSPLKESGDVITMATTTATAATTTVLPPARDEKLETHNQINTLTATAEGVGFANITPTKITDELSVSSENLTKKLPKEMDSNLLEEMSDNFQNCKEPDDKLDKFLQDMSSFAPPTTNQPQLLKHDEPPEITDKQKTEDFLKEETKTIDDKAELLTDSDEDDDDDDDFKPSKYQDFPKQVELPELTTTIIDKKPETFKDIEEKIITKQPTPEMEKITSSPPPPPPAAAAAAAVAPVKEIKPTAPPAVGIVVVPKKEAEELICLKPTVTTGEQQKQIKKPTIIDAEAIFCKMGLDTWFHPERLNPKVESLIYWRDPKKSGPIFGGVLLSLLSLTYFSLISVIAYLSLLALTGTISFRIYKNVVQAVQKTGDGHPFKEYLEFDVVLPQDKVKEISEVAVAHLNAALIELRRLFLVEDLVDSVKFGVLLWTLTYLGAWFNGMTLIIIAWVALFTLPKVYETNKTQIDANLEIVRTKLAEITAKVKAAIPIGKKPAPTAVVEEKKEQ